MTAEEDRLIAFLVGEADRAPKPAANRVPRNRAAREKNDGALSRYTGPPRVSKARRKSRSVPAPVIRFGFGSPIEPQEVPCNHPWSRSGQ